MPILAAARQHSLQGIQLRGSVPEAQMMDAWLFVLALFMIVLGYNLAFREPPENTMVGIFGIVCYFGGIIGIFLCWAHGIIV
jgi:hypothetical protein